MLASNFRVISIVPAQSCPQRTKPGSGEGFRKSLEPLPEKWPHCDLLIKTACSHTTALPQWERRSGKTVIIPVIGEAQSFAKVI